MIKGTRAMSVFVGIIILGTTYVLTKFFNLHYTRQILSYFFDHLIFIVILLFQEEIRRTLADIGRRASSVGKKANLFNNKPVKTSKEISETLADVCFQMAKEHLGGLIIIEREDRLKSLIETGSSIYAQVKAELIYAIFLHGSPIHDGAIIISQSEIAAAGCFLPISREAGLNKKYGTRHRAAIATSQAYDCIVVVVSEETGHINLAVDGKMNHNLSPEELKQALIVLQNNESTTLNLIQQVGISIKNGFNKLKNKIGKK